MCACVLREGCGGSGAKEVGGGGGVMERTCLSGPHPCRFLRSGGRRWGSQSCVSVRCMHFVLNTIPTSSSSIPWSIPQVSVLEVCRSKCGPFYKCRRWWCGELIQEWSVRQVSVLVQKCRCWWGAVLVQSWSVCTSVAVGLQ